MLNDSPLATLHSPLDSPLAARDSPLDSPLRILTVANVPPDPNSGAAGTVYYTNVALRELGHQVDEIWADQLGPRRIQHGNLHSLLEQPRAYRREVMKAVDRKTYDVVMISQPQAYLAARALRRRSFPGVIVNRSHGLELRADASLPKWHRKLGVPQNRFPRNLVSRPLQALLHRQWTAIVADIDGVVVPCEMDRDFLRQQYPEATPEIRTIHHGVSNALLTPPLAPWSDERRKRLLHVGQFAFFKGPHLVALIANRALDRSPELSFTWVTSKAGCASAAELINPVHRHRAKFLPWTSQEELRQIFDSHGIFLFPTLCEGAAKSALEAMARGLCVVGSDDSGTRDYIDNGVNGRRCPVGNVEEFANAILEISVQDNAAEISRAAHGYAAGKSWSVCAQGLIHFFRALGAKYPTQ